MELTDVQIIFFGLNNRLIVTSFVPKLKDLIARSSITVSKHTESWYSSYGLAMMSCGC